LFIAGVNLTASAGPPETAIDLPSAQAVVRSSLAITLDGRLDEPAWRDAPVLKLTQQSPNPGEPTPYDTEVRVLVSKEAIYFGFLCRDPNPKQIAIHSMRRDSLMKGDDSVSVILDTYGDHRTGYFFEINAAGARSDGLVSNPQRVSLDWDGIWDARTARLADGWSAEIVIPSITLSFTRDLDSWGLNLGRFVPREQLSLRWSSPTLDSLPYDLSRAGTLTGIGDLKQGKGIEVSPYALGRTKEAFRVSPRAWQGAVGGEVTWKITPQLVTVFTANTDFAETEVDTRQINLTRFPLFFPEKRAFFLEGANQYAFGLGLDNDRMTQFVPFFSRRVGLLGGAQIPIDAGVKLNGRVGRWNLAFLDVQTRQTLVPLRTQQNLRLPSAVLPGTNLLATRVSYDVNKNLRVGTILTHGDPQAIRNNTLAGVDAVWRTSKFLRRKNFLVGGWTGTTEGDTGPGSKMAWGFRVEYPNDLWDCAMSLNQFGDAFEPLLGFVPRRGVRRLGTHCNYQPRPSKDGPFRWIRQEFFENRYSRFTNYQGIVESSNFRMTPVHLRLESGDRLEFNWNPQAETLLVPFRIAPGVVIPAGGYQFTRWRIEGDTSEHRPLQFGASTWFGSFYNGRLTQWKNFVRWTSSKGRVQLEADAENNFGRLPEGTFVQRLWQVQAAYAWNPNLVLTSFLQYDTESQNIGTNTRLRWTIKPGNDFFIVWNRGWHRLILSPQDISILPESDFLVVKLRWTFRR
jgi:hypothetical protein